MKLIIDIDDELYKAICDCDDGQILSHIAIKNGTPYEERPHGEWIPFSGDSLDVRMRCSVCGSVEMPLLRHNFCPNCGAEMRKEGESCDDKET